MSDELKRAEDWLYLVEHHYNPGDARIGHARAIKAEMGRLRKELKETYAIAIGSLRELSSRGIIGASTLANKLEAESTALATETPPRQAGATQPPGVLPRGCNE